MPGRSRIRTVTGAGLLTLVSALLAASQAQGTPVADAGALRADVTDDPWSLALLDAEGETVLAEDPSTSPGAPGTLGFRSAGVWQHATRVLSSGQDAGAYVAQLATTDPAGRTIEVRIGPGGEGVIGFDAVVRGPGPPIEAVGVGFGARAKERYLGFGERSNAIDQRGGVVENYVSDGPYEADERDLISFFIPPWGFRPRDDATYYPVPWLLSSTGYGVLVDSPNRRRPGFPLARLAEAAARDGRLLPIVLRRCACDDHGHARD